MKIIDLLNKIANGEEVPKKVKYENRILYLDDEEDEYEPTFNYYDINGEHSLFNGWTSNYLNHEVEIPEEEHKIPEKLNLGNATINEQQIEFKINEIIDCLDYLKSKGE